jgi:photosystem II stability/assembly factor-like uncharacterized protein
MMKRSLAVRWRTGLLLAILVVAAVTAGPVNPRFYAGMAWRNIGPFRAGRVSAVTGVVGRPGTFYAGLPLGGVWKTTSAGETWYPVFDSVKEVSCIGALQVAPSDPDIIYAGTGDLITGGGINEGNGIYKSSDAGKTWTHLGLDDSKQIPAILVDPRDPRIVLLAAQGNVHTHSEVRGVFRTADGGQNWTRTLYVDNETGAQALAWAYDQPGVVLATTVRHYTAPGGGPRGGAPAAAPGGPPAAAAPPSGTKLFKSLDQGLTWKEITGGGLPALAGRTSVAVAINTKAQRMFIVGSFGLYRSDDGGANWRQMAASDRRIVGSGYLCGIYVDPQNPDIVYNLNTSSYRSLDGGGTFTGFKGAPGGDDPQQMWIDPTDGQRMFLGVDQGATISLDGGRTWSSWYNQPTGQIYHISTDNRYPYWVYGSQQDSGTVATRSRGDFGEITPLDWYPTPGYEFGSPLPDPRDPNIIYEGGPGNGIVKVSMPSGQWINVSPNVDAGLGLRKVTNQPMLFLPSDTRRLLVGFQYVMATADGGQHWNKISPDLTVPKGQPAAAPNAAPGAGARGGAIESMSASTAAAGTIWVGTNNGLIQVTRVQGVKWEDVSITGLPNGARADISAIEASHHDPAAAYAAVDCHTVGDYRPYLYRTRDYGRTWTPIVDGLAVDEPSGSFARVIRADTKKSGLLFAGTESAVYVSFDDGDHWQSLMLNLPNTSYRDMTIHGADLVAATYGRGIWILDDISPLRQMTPALAAEPAYLFQPAPAIRVRRSVNGDTPFPPEVPHALNPPLGAIIDYLLAAKPAGTITLEILDAAGAVVRHLSSAPIPPLPDPPPAVPDYWLEKPKPMPVEAGLNRISWNLRYDAPPAFTHNYAQVMGAVPGDTPATPEGPLAPPGVYTLKLGADGRTYSRKLTVTNDPRSPATAADLQAQHELQMRLYDGIRQAWDAYQQVAAMRLAVAAIPRSGLSAEAAAAVTAFDAKLAALAGSPGSGRGRGAGGFGGPGGGTPPPPNFAGLNASLVRQLDTLDYGDLAPTEAMLKAGASGAADLRTALNGWRSLNLKDLADFNVLLIKNNVKPIPAAVLGPAGGPGKKPRP